MRPVNQSPASSLSSGKPEGQHLPLAVLRQYVAGTLPAADQHRIEAHTQACPRCADVLEGLSQTDLATTDEALTDLQARLRARVAAETPDATPVVPLWPWRQMVAAVLVLLVSAGVWLGVRRTTEGPAAAARVALQQSDNQRKIAPVAAGVEVADDALASASTPTKEAVTRKPPKPPVVALQRARRQQIRHNAAAGSPVIKADKKVAGNAADVGGVTGAGSGSAAVAADTVQLAAMQVPAAAPRQEAYSMRGAAKSKVQVATSAAAAEPTPASAASSAMSAQITSTAPAPAGTRVVRGRVTDRGSGAGLPGVTVLAKGTSTGTTTAADGSFALLVPAATEALSFSYIGYSSSEQPLTRADSTLALALAPDTKQLSEVVVVRREPPPAPMAIGALPAGGYTAFREYLKKELEYPEKALKDGIEGTVKLRFVVAVDGTLQDVKVVRGLSEECDVEAVRLLKEGPKWYPAIQKGRRTARPVEVSVPFRLESQR